MSVQVLIVFVVVMVAYLFPTVVATSRKHRNAGAIAVLNIFLGWSLLGWVFALVWASTSDVEGKRVR